MGKGARSAKLYKKRKESGERVVYKSPHIGNGLGKLVRKLHSAKQKSKRGVLQEIDGGLQTYLKNTNRARGNDALYVLDELKGKYPLAVDLPIVGTFKVEYRGSAALYDTENFVKVVLAQAFNGTPSYEARIIAYSGSKGGDVFSKKWDFLKIFGVEEDNACRLWNRIQQVCDARRSRRNQRNIDLVRVQLEYVVSSTASTGDPVPEDGRLHRKAFVYISLDEPVALVTPVGLRVDRVRNYFSAPGRQLNMDYLIGKDNPGASKKEKKAELVGAR